MRILSLMAIISGLVLFGDLALAQPAGQPQGGKAKLPSDTPAEFKVTNEGFDYTKRDVMIPMRDGVKLHTVIIVPKGCEARSDSAHANSL